MRRIVIHALCLLLVQAGAAFAQYSRLAEMSLEELGNIRVTTATRTSERARDVPARIEVVTADQIELRGYRSLTDVLRDLPDFKVELGADQDLPVDIVVQGTRGSGRIVLLLDGIRISSPTGEPIPILANYPVHTAAQIEIVYGPGSALYGADAFSAVVNIISKDADEAEGVAVASSYGQFGLSNTTGSYGVRLGDRVRLLVSGQLLHDGQPRMPRYYPGDFAGLEGQRSGTFNTIFGPMQSTSPVPREYTNALSARSLHALVSAGGFQFMLFQNSATVPTAPATTPDNAVYSDEAFNRNNLVVAAGTYARQVGVMSSTSTVTASWHELDPQSGYRNTYSNMNRSYKYAFGSMGKVEQQFSWKNGTALTTTVGAMAERFFSVPQGADLNAPIQSRDVPGTMLGTSILDDFYRIRYQNYAAYGQAQYAATPTLALTVGSRVDHNTRYGSTINPRLALVWQPGGSSSIKVLYGSAFLAPSPYQQYAHYGSFYSVDGGATYASSFWHLPNPALKAQKKKTIEVEARRAVGAGAEVWGSTFYSRFTDLVREGADREDRYAGFYKGWPVDFIEISVNAGSEKRYGGSAGIDVVRLFGSRGQIAGRMALSLADGTIEEPGSDHRLQIGGLAPAQLHTHADLTWDKWSASPRLLLVGRQRVLGTEVVRGERRRRTLDGYALLTLHIRRQNVFRNVDAFLTVENALDRRYRNINLRAYTHPEELIGAPQNPRRITAGFQVRVP